MTDAVRVMELEWGNNEHGVALLADTEFDMVLVSDCGKHLPSDAATNVSPQLNCGSQCTGQSSSHHFVTPCVK